MLGFILEEGLTTTSHRYDAPSLARNFPNLDLLDSEGHTGVDTISISFFASGLEEGKPSFRARQILLQGEELLALP